MTSRLSQENLRKATIYIGEQNYHQRQLLRDLFMAQGVRQVVCHSTMDSLRKLMFEMPPDLLVVADDFHKEIFSFIREIRFHRLGDNPFMLISMLVDPNRGESLDRAIGAGVDDIIIKPVSAERVQERLRLVTFHRRPFIATDGYVGPERKAEDARGQRPRRIAVVNTLLEKVSGREMDKLALKAAVEGSLQRVLKAQLDSQSFRLGEVCERLVSAFETGAINDDVQADLMTLGEVLRNAAGVADRLKDTQLSTLCSSLAENVDGMASRYTVLLPAEIELIGKITHAFKMAMKPSEPTTDSEPDALDLGQFQ